MNKTLLGLFAVGMIAAFTSCKKDYKCECSVSSGGTSASVTYDIKDVTKKDAKAACEKHQTAVAGITYSCSLK